MEFSIQRNSFVSNLIQILRLCGHAAQDAILLVSLSYRRYKARQELLSLPMSVREDVGLTHQKIDKFIKEMK